MTLDQLFHPLTVIRREMEENPQGFILLPCFTESPVSGYAVAVRETQNSFGLTGLLKALTFALENGLSFGGWYNEANGQFYFDAVRLFAEGELQQATEFGKKNGQIALYDIGNGITVNLQTLTASKRHTLAEVLKELDELFPE